MLDPISSVRKFCSHALLGVLALATAAGAQTAPQLMPYTSRLIAGGGAAAIAAGATCPVSGNTSLDAYGDGCLATEILLVSPRAAAADIKGNVFFTDYTNGLIRRVDALTGIVTAVAGGATSSPAAGTACGINLSADARGDGCLGTAVKLSHPASLTFSSAGDLYFSDTGYANVRKIAATAGLITTTGVISLVDGNVATTYGYTSNFGTTTVNAATASYLHFPYSLAFDPAGNLYIADEYTNAIVVVNTNTSGTTNVTGVAIPAGTVSKILGSVLAGGSVCPNSPASPAGCNYGLFTNGNPANASLVDAPYAVTFDPFGKVYFSNEYNNNVGVISSTGILTNFAGIQGSVAKVLKRGVAGTFAIGSSFGIVADTLGNVYITDASSGVVWRVDAGTNNMYVVAGGATTVCAGAANANGDNCPALQARFGSSGTSYASTTAPGPGIFGISVDTNQNLYVGDTETNVVREIATGAQFGVIGANQPTQTLELHFAVNDAPGTYTLTSGATSFSLGTAACTSNSDGTTDCLLPVTATPTVLGGFAGTLKVTSAQGASASFALSGTFVQSPVTQTQLAYTVPVTCTGTTTYSATTPVTLNARVSANGPAPPTGTIAFLANGVQIGTSQPITNTGTTSAPVYGASLTYTFSTPATYILTATYSGDTYFKPSTGTSSNSVTSATSSFAVTPVTNTQGPVAAGQTALFSFNLVQSLYTGTLNFACSGLPAGASCSFSPSSIVGTGCSTTNVIALSILTQQALPLTGAFGMGFGTAWQVGLSLLSLALALVIGLQRRRIRFAQLWMVLLLLVAANGALGCGSGAKAIAATPSGTYPVTVAVNGSTGPGSTLVITLKVQ